MRLPFGPCILFAASLLVVAPFTLGEEGAADSAAVVRTVDFGREVRPILAQHCFRCHGPDENARKAGLRLDLRTEAFADHDGTQAIVPGDLDRSELVARIAHNEPLERMPPVKDGIPPLDAAQIETLKAWVAQGATWPEHWAFVPPQRAAAPALSDSAWARDDIDRFVLARLEREGLRPEVEASREAWLRRASFDLTGLPPTCEELDAFLADKAADAYEKQVDRLLASPRYGERQAQDWLDVARYADSSGYQLDTDRNAWKWRDWVVSAFNRHMPFDQFTIEQLAGDLLPNATLDQRVATGFNRNHPTNSEGGEEIDEYRSAYVIDRVNTTATAWMGLTLGCCQCHDHKYDPLTQKDFYRFYAFFNNVKERDSDFFTGKNPRPTIAVPSADQAPRLVDVESRIAQFEKRLEIDDPLTDAAQQAWEKATLERLGEPLPWTTLEPSGMLAQQGSLLEKQSDGSILSTGPTPVKDSYDLVFRPGKRKIQALRLEVLPDPSQPKGGSGRADDGRFILSRIAVRASTLSESEEPPVVNMIRAEPDLRQERRYEDLESSYDEQPGDIEGSLSLDDVAGGGQFGMRSFDGWSYAGEERKQRHEAVLLPLEPIELNDVAVLRVSLSFASSLKFKSLIGRFRLSFTEDERVRRFYLPVTPKNWRAIGPFPAADVVAAWDTAFEPEAGVKGGVDFAKKFVKPVLPKPDEKSGKDDKGKPDTPGKPGKVDASEAPPVAKDASAATEMPPAAQVEPIEKAAVAAPGEKVEPAKAAKSDEPDEAKKAAKDEPSKKDEQEKKDAKPRDAAPEAGGDGKPEEKKPEKLAWSEKPKWRDREAARLEGSNAAWYVARQVVTAKARTARVEIDGPAGVRVWVNGEVVYSSPPPAPVPPKDKDKDKAKEKGKDKDDEGDDDFFGSSRRAKAAAHSFQIGLREGANEVVVKSVFGESQRKGRGQGFPMGDMAPPGMGSREGGGSFTFTIEAEGDDLLSHEVVVALREEARARAEAAAAPPAQAAAGALSEAPVAGGPSAGDPATANRAAVAAPVPADAAAEKDPKHPTPEARRRAILRKFYRSNLDTIGRVVAAELRKAKAEKQQLEREIPQALVMDERDSPREAHVFLRGHYKSKGEAVAADVPSILPPLPADQPKNRLALARWLVSGENPLTARVIVNRVWQQFFGAGLVRTVEDFGIRCELPSHPELLDALAVDFVASGWDFAKLQKRIALSSTYRQASTIAPAKLEKDPENRLLSRGPRHRLSAEMVRDNALFMAGLLVEKLGGKPVKPFQPPGLWKSVSGDSRDWKQDSGEDQYRRGLYVYWKRGVPYPSLTTFDAAKRETCTVTRAYTNTPLQALVLLNDPVYVEAARAFGQRLLLEGGRDDAARLAFGFRYATSRAPSPADVEVLAKLLAASRELYRADVEAAKKLLAVGEFKADEKKEPAELAAWAAVGAALLNLDETIHKG